MQEAIRFRKSTVMHCLLAIEISKHFGPATSEEQELRTYFYSVFNSQFSDA